MKAIISTNYKLPCALQLQGVNSPEPKDDEVLIKVLASSSNNPDCQRLQGTPFVNRLMTGLLKPLKSKYSTVISGQIETVGEKTISTMEYTIFTKQIGVING